MTALAPHELADRIESLDWSRTSLQHQLVMSAAILALRGSPEAPLENPVGEMQLLLSELVNMR
jgi:hypothetical protein